jgi:cytochrome c oxidase subunit III
MMNAAAPRYHVPASSPWPLVGSVGLFVLVLGVALALDQSPIGAWLALAGVLIVVVMLWGWFGNVVVEGLQGLYSTMVERSFRWSMGWFIFSEVMFFAGFFGALFYARHFAVPWLGGHGGKALAHSVLWPSFTATWPLLQLPDPSHYAVARQAMEAAGLPAINTLVLLSSGAAVTWAHWGLMRGRRGQLVAGLALTVALGGLFLSLQGYEYWHAYTVQNLRLDSGIYGSTFFMLTGFHGLHVTIGAIMLSAVLGRALAGHFTAENHFAFLAAAWYWHFVDVVWLLLFVFVYVL